VDGGPRARLGWVLAPAAPDARLRDPRLRLLVNHFGLVSQTPFDLMRVGCPVQFSEIDQLKITMEIARRNTEAGLGATGGRVSPGRTAFDLL
jgi:hypothetical protein